MRASVKTRTSLNLLMSDHLENEQTFKISQLPRIAVLDYTTEKKTQ